MTMTKNDLIAYLSNIPGNPRIMVMDGENCMLEAAVPVQVVVNHRKRNRSLMKTTWMAARPDHRNEEVIVFVSPSEEEWVKDSSLSHLPNDKTHEDLNDIIVTHFVKQADRMLQSGLQEKQLALGREIGHKELGQLLNPPREKTLVSLKDVPADTWFQLDCEDDTGIGKIQLCTDQSASGKSHLRCQTSDGRILTIRDDYQCEILW